METHPNWIIGAIFIICVGISLAINHALYQASGLVGSKGRK